MRGNAKLFAMVALAAGLAVVPALGSQGAGALGESRSHDDSHILTSTQSPLVLDVADRLAASRVAEVVAS